MRSVPPSRAFLTEEGIPVPAVTAAQMREVDRVAAEVYGLTVLQMMEHAGRTLAEHAVELSGGEPLQITVLAGSGGNGGGGLCAARHLANRGWPVAIVLDRQPEALGEAAAHHLAILRAMGLKPTAPRAALEVVSRSAVVVDALIGYGLRDAPHGLTADLIGLCSAAGARVLSLDVPSGLDATTGEAPGVAVRPQRTLTLALPKTGLTAVSGDLYLADIGIPRGVYAHIGLPPPPPFGRRWSLRLLRAS